MRYSVVKVFLLIAVFAFCSCASYRSVNTSALRIGMTKADAQAALRKQPSNTVAAKKDPLTNKIIEVVEYTNNIDNNKGTYWLYFVNDHLERWELANKYGPAI